MYNKVFGSETYQQSVKPYIDTALGGTLHLFADKVRSSSYYSRGVGEVVLSVYATCPMADPGADEHPHRKDGSLTSVSFGGDNGSSGDLYFYNPIVGTHQHLFQESLRAWRIPLHTEVRHHQQGPHARRR